MPHVFFTPPCNYFNATFSHINLNISYILTYMAKWKKCQKHCLSEGKNGLKHFNIGFGNKLVATLHQRCSNILHTCKMNYVSISSLQSNFHFCLTILMSCTLCRIIVFRGKHLFKGLKKLTFGNNLRVSVIMSNERNYTKVPNPKITRNHEKKIFLRCIKG